MHDWQRIVRCAVLVGAAGVAGRLAAQPARATAETQVPTAELDSLIRLAGPVITESLLRRHVSELASDAYGGRGAGYAGEQQAIRYVAREFLALGLTPMGDSAGGQRTFVQHFQLVPRHPLHPGDVLESANVLAMIEGSDPALAREVVVVGAHHDGQGRIGEADPGRSMPAGSGPLRDSIWNSADDNASSVGVVLAIARAIRTSGVRLRRTVIIATFGAEEPDLGGSLYYVGHPPLPWEQHVAMFTMEQMGRHADMQPIAMDAGTSSDWPALLDAANAATGVHVTILSPEVIQDSDHYGFAVRGLPAIVFGVNHDDDIHLPSDEWDKFDFPAYTARARFALALLFELADAPTAPTRTTRPLCHNGTHIADLDERCSSPFDPGIELADLTDAEHAAAHLGATEGGLKVMTTVATLSAERAGLRPGDIVVSLQGAPLTANPSRRALHLALDASRGHAVMVVVLRGRSRRQLVVSALADTRP